MDIKELNILFLAKFAPNEDDESPLITENTDGIYAQYHYDVYRILKNICPNTNCARNPDILLNGSKKFDYVFTLLNRAPYRNSEIFVSALLEYLQIPYLGSTPNIRALAEDKHLAKLAAKQSGLSTPDWIIVNVNDNIPISKPFEGPFFVKPRFGASSAYIDENSIASNWNQAQKRINQLQQANLDVIVEKFADGMYYSVPIYFKNNQIIHLPAIEEKSSLPGNVVTYRQKRKLDTGLTRNIITRSDLQQHFVKLSDDFLRDITPLDYTRIDFIVTNNSIEFIEFNICCNLGKQSSFCIAANSVGISQETLIKEILLNSLCRQNVLG